MPTQDWWVVRVPLAPVSTGSNGVAPSRCPRCGCPAFTVHQRLAKALKDPHVTLVQVVRYQCKKCGAIVRRYPAGVLAGRQSRGLRQLSVLLYCLGLSYRDIQQKLLAWNCPLSATAIRRNVVVARRIAPAWLVTGRCSLAVDPEQRWGPEDGPIDLQLGHSTSEQRWLEVCVQPHVGREVEPRLLACAAWLQENPPESF